MAITDSKKPRQLLQQSEKILLHPIHPHLFAYCPTMDLIALVTAEENLDVYRINGQLAFSLRRKSEDVCVDAVQWEFNGKSVAVAWSDGSVDLVSAESGKVVGKDLVLPRLDGEDGGERVKAMGWALNFIDPEKVKRRTGEGKDVFGQPTTEEWDAFGDDTSVEDFLQRQPDFQKLDVAPDLPDLLAMMDVEALLPKLPAIPAPPALPFMRVAQAEAGGFGAQVDVDAVLHSSHLRDYNSVDLFVRCSERGGVHPSMYDSKETVDIHLPTAWNIESTPLLHTSHPYSCSHSLLMRTKSPESKKEHIAYVPLTLNFIPAAGIYLHLIASKTSQLQNLLLYITTSLQRIRTFFKHATDLPSKFMLNISEPLEEKGLGDLVTNLFHIACTGNCPPLIKNWLVDELTEAGHKRWDNTVTTGLNAVLAIVHENLVPAIDRCSIIISRLRGLAEFHRDREWIFNTPADFTDLLESLKNLRLLAHTVMLYGAEEKRNFAHFSKWLRFCIDFEATEAESQSRVEMEARDPGVDIMLVLEYIQFGLVKSSLAPYLREAHGKGEKVGYEDTKRAVEVLKDGGGYREDAVCLENVLGQLREGVKGVLGQVGRWQEGNVRMDTGIVLEEASDEDTPLDMRMVAEPSTLSTYIALSPPSSNALHIHRIAKDIASHAISTLSFPRASSVLDAKFADDMHLLVLLQTPIDGEERANLILSIPYTQASAVTYTPVPDSVLASTMLPQGARAPDTVRMNHDITTDMVEQYTRHVFEGRFTPLRLVVNGRKGRRVVVVLGSDRKHYRVLDLDYRRTGKRVDESSGSEDDGEGEEDEDVDMGGA
ncbi:anaphase-promoting complex subunit 4 [Parastagonospora nodorum]|nr:anaphase-promoting complex subunit 4 [Parastagonospora nodorum]